MTSLLRVGAALLAGSLVTSACTPQQSGDETGPAAASPAKLPALSAGPLRSAGAVPATRYDTLQVPGGIVQVRPRTAADFERQPASPHLLLERPDEAPTSPGQWDNGRVRRQGDQLRLQPAAGPAVLFRRVPNRQPPGAVSDGGTYQYKGQWPAAGFWLVEYDGLPRSFTLVEQRTGRHTQLASPDMSFSRDGRYLLLLNARYVDGQAPPYGLALYQLSPTGTLARLRWLRELPAWGTLTGARWADQRTVVLRRSSIPERLHEVAVTSYVELQLPVAR